ncbi:MAG: NAD(P)/FAD-dependent oxidoreductase [Pseudomonadota bacterium]
MNTIADREFKRLKLRVLGAGPAGLTAAYEAQKFFPNGDIIVFEASEHMGGIARTEEHNGYRFDIGGHRFFTKETEVNEFWYEILGDDFITVPRKSRIYYRGQFFDYPLRLFNALSNIGPYESMRILASYLKWQVRPHRTEDTFEEWVINRFGGRLYMHFFRTYTEKVWGIPANTIRADWAAQRIKNLTLSKAVWNAIFGTNDTASLIEEFQYPRLGPGMMWEETAKRVKENGGKVATNAPVVAVRRDDMRIVSIDVANSYVDGGVETVEADEFISTLALRDLVNMITPLPPQEVVDAANRMRYRDFLIVTLVLDDSDPFPDNWIYVHSPEVRVGRIQNFRAWSEELLPDKDTASIGMEYFCNEDDDLWCMDDDDLVQFAGAELEKIGLSKAKSVKGGFVIRQRKAYPVYDPESKEAVETVSNWLKQLENFQTVGRNGLHRYNNQDHSMLTAMYAARNLAGASYDIWDVNLDRSYHEEMEVSKEAEDAATPALAKVSAAR